MNRVKKVFASKEKNKEKITLLSLQAKKDSQLLDEIVNYFPEGTKAEQGHCIEVLEYVSQENPELIKPYFPFVQSHLNHNSSRVKWESARVIGNLAPFYPQLVAESVDKLLCNANDQGTVVRWSVAFALTRIAQSNLQKRDFLLLKFKEIVKTEDNNGVRKIYQKALIDLA